MKVKAQTDFIPVNGMLRKRIKEKYKTVRRFSQKAGFSESAVSKMLNGTRKVYPWSWDVFVKVLEIPQTECSMYVKESV